MSRRFLEEATRAELTGAVVELEAQTSAEVVVTVRGASARYREGDYLAGFAGALAALLFLLYLPWSFPLYTFPLDVAAAFALMAFIASRAPGLRRRFVAKAAQREAVRLAAEAAFYELGVSATTGRTGILIYVSLLEGRVKLVPDLGVDRSALEPAWSDAERGMEAALGRGDVEAFRQAMLGLGPELAIRLPRSADDVNELADEVRA